MDHIKGDQKLVKFCKQVDESTEILHFTEDCTEMGAPYFTLYRKHTVCLHVLVRPKNSKCWLVAIFNDYIPNAVGFFWRRKKLTALNQVYTVSPELLKKPDLLTNQSIQHVEVPKVFYFAMRVSAVILGRPFGT